MNNFTEEERKKAFVQHRINGFYLNFPNGNGLSTIWGVGTHTENHMRIEEISLANMDIKNDKDWHEKYMKQWNTPLSSNDVEVMPDCSPDVYKLLTDTFPENENSGIFDNLTFTQWLQIVNILNENK